MFPPTADPVRAYLVTTILPARTDRPVGSCKFRLRVRAASAGVPLHHLGAVVASEGRAKRLPKG